MEPVNRRTTYRHGAWYASITLAWQPQRACGSVSMAFDWEIATFATIATDDGSMHLLDNPRFLTNGVEALTAAHRSRDNKQQCSRGWQRANRRVARLHGTIARQCLDFHHKQSAQMVGAAGAIFTETLHVKNMTRRLKPQQDAITGQPVPNGAAAKAGLNKAILDGAPAQSLGILRYKAAEAGLVYAEAPTSQLKPSQTWHQCGRRARQALSVRWHSCPCGVSCGRDMTAALVVLDWGVAHFLAVLLAWLWLYNNRSQELAAYRGVQNLLRAP